jgi:hypothetical protein
MGTTLLIALVAAVCSIVVVGMGTDAMLNATAPSCPSTGEGTCAGVVAGLVTAWRMSRSLRLVLGGLMATLGASVLLAESLVVLALWAA